MNEPQDARSGQPRAEGRDAPQFPGYHLLESLGDDGIVARYRAVRLPERTEVSLHVLDQRIKVGPGFQVRLQKAVQLSQTIENHHLTQVHEAVFAANRCAVCTELVYGKEVSRVLSERGGPLPFEIAVECLIGILSGLSALHSVQLVHHHLRPSNVIVLDSDRILLDDWTIPSAFSSEEQHSAEMLGYGADVSFAAPELRRGHNCGIRADIFSVGAIGYLLVTGWPPLFTPESTQAPDPRAFNAEVPEGLVNVIQRALSAEPDQRFADPQAMMDALAPFANRSTEIFMQHASRVSVAAASASDDSWAERPAASSVVLPKKSPTVPAWGIFVLILGGLLVIALVLGYVLFQDRNDPVPKSVVSMPAKQVPQIPVLQPVAKPISQPALALNLPKPVWASAVGRDPYGVWADCTLKGIVIRFSRVDPGNFIMGDASGDASVQPHRVELTKPYWLSRTEVHQALWQALLLENPSNFKGPDLPVERVSWKLAQDFLAALNSQISGEHFRLPTEAEWEWAARSSTTSQISGWNSVTAGGTTHAVGQLPPNPLGIHDLHGNVLEWCLDGYQDYGAADRRDPFVAPSEAIFRVARGGSWTMPPAASAPWARHRYQPFTQLFFIGMRIAANG